MNTALKIVFAGTPEFSVPTLEALLRSTHDVVAVYTQPDKPAGRGRRLSMSAVKQTALANQLPIEQPAHLRDAAAWARLREYAPDIMIVVAYGLLLPAEVLAIPDYGCVNVHASILPCWRGAAPIARAIEAGDTQTGVSIMQMDQGLDTGSVFSHQAIAIAADDNSATLHDKLAALGASLLLDTLAQFDTVSSQPQDDTMATYAHKLTKAEALLEWRAPAKTLYDRIRAFYPWPIAYFARQDKMIRVHAAEVVSIPSDVAAGTVLQVDKQGILIATGDGGLLLTSLQLPGGKPLTAAALFNGHAHLFREGDQL